MVEFENGLVFRIDLAVRNGVEFENGLIFIKGLEALGYKENLHFDIL